MSTQDAPSLLATVPVDVLTPAAVTGCHWGSVRTPLYRCSPETQRADGKYPGLEKPGLSSDTDGCIPGGNIEENWECGYLRGQFRHGAGREGHG